MGLDGTSVKTKGQIGGAGEFSTQRTELKTTKVSFLLFFSFFFFLIFFCVKSNLCHHL